MQMAPCHCHIPASFSRPTGRQEQTPAEGRREDTSPRRSSRTHLVGRAGAGIAVLGATGVALLGGDHPGQAAALPQRGHAALLLGNPAGPGQRRQPHPHGLGPSPGMPRGRLSYSAPDTYTCAQNYPSRRGTRVF